MKKKIPVSGIVYSTDKNFSLEEEASPDIVLPAGEQRLKVKLETKNRGGKAVTVVEGYIGAGADELGKHLKGFCGTGGSVKDGIIIVQGDNREKIKQWLIKNGYKKTT